MPAHRNNRGAAVLVSVDRTLFHQLGVSRLTYVRALRRAGLAPRLVDYGAVSAAESLSGMHGLVLAGGGDVDPALYGEIAAHGRDTRPARDRFELALLEEARRRDLPVLGICRGAQLINVARGGTLRDLRSDPRQYARHHRLRGGHPVEFEPDSRLSAIYGRSKLESVVSYHGQAVDQLGPGLRVAARSRDGIVEAIETESGETSTGFGTVGVQWHPEAALFDASQQPLFRAFSAAVEAHRRRHEREAAPMELMTRD